jgi:hypothetical protein
VSSLLCRLACALSFVQVEHVEAHEVQCRYRVLDGRVTDVRTPSLDDLSKMFLYPARWLVEVHREPRRARRTAERV